MTNETGGQNEVGCRVGILEVRNGVIRNAEALGSIKIDVENDVRSRFSGLSRKQLKKQFPLNIFTEYYRRFGYSYHVLGQLESVIAGKDINTGHPAVDVMLAGEIKNQLLTAAHDLQKLEFPIQLHKSEGGENYIQLGGKMTETLAGDWRISDLRGVISSILRGPDQRTAIHPDTVDILYTAYGLPGISENLLANHLNDMERWIRQIACEADICALVLPAEEFFASHST